MDTIISVIVILTIIIAFIIFALDRRHRKRELKRAFALLEEAKLIEKKLSLLKNKGFITTSSKTDLNIESTSFNYIEVCDELSDQMFDLILEAEFLLLNNSRDVNSYNENK